MYRKYIVWLISSNPYAVVQLDCSKLLTFTSYIFPHSSKETEHFFLSIYNMIIHVLLDNLNLCLKLVESFL